MIGFRALALAAALAANEPAAIPVDRPSSWPDPFSFFVTLAGAYDSNIDNDDEDPVQSVGRVVGVGTRFETDDIEIEYEVASHSYTNTDRWDRVSHSLRTSFEQDLTDRLSLEWVGEAALKGSSEDRERGDEYVVEPRLEYRLSDFQRLRLYGAYRLRYAAQDPRRDATNQYLGAEFRQRLGSGVLDLGYRWETNHAEGERNRYRRQTYGVDYSTPLRGGHRLAVGLKYRPQQYSARFVDDDEEEGLRRDARWVFSLGGSFALGPRLELHPTYKFQARTSNDPEEEYRAHVAYIGLRYWLGSDGNLWRSRNRGPSQPTLAALESGLESKKAALAPAEQAEAPGDDLRSFRGSVLRCSGALPRAQVRMIGSRSSHGVETSATGEFSFDAIPAGTYELQVEAGRGGPDPEPFRARIDLARSISGYVAELDCAEAVSSRRDAKG